MTVPNRQRAIPETSRIRRRLLAWFRRERRSLPWRATRDPYRIWISEVMLQQTTVGAVAPRYEAFLERFPDVVSLARAREDSVLAAWSGLGYYARARNLKRAARRILLEHGGRIPAEPQALAELPGFGAYISAAVACLAFGARVPAAEANVSRVLSRVFVIGGSRAARQREVLDRAGELLPRARPGNGLAALMDLGQLVCTPRRPRCLECPIADECGALALRAVDRYPAPTVASPMATVHVAAALVLRNGRVLLERRRTSYLAGLWTFPLAEAKSAAAARRALIWQLRARSIRVLPRAAVARATHTIMRRRLEIEVFRAVPAAELSGGNRERWISPAALDLAATPTLTRKIARAAGFVLEASAAARPADARREA